MTIRPWFLVVGGVLTMFCAATVRAGNLTWNVPGDGTWDTATANWTGDSTVYTEGDTVTFNNAAGGVITLSGNRTPGGVIVSAAAGTYMFTNASITGSGKLTKSGAGKLQLRAANTFTGGIDISGGEIDVDLLNRLSGAAPGNVSTIHVIGNATITVNNPIPGASGGNTYDPMVIDAGVTVTFNRTLPHATYPNYMGNISGDGAVTIASTGGNYFRLSGSNSFKGNLNLTGNGAAGADYNLGDTNNLIILNGGGAYFGMSAGAVYGSYRTLQIVGGSLQGNNGWTWPGLVIGNGFTSGGSLVAPLFLANSNNSFVGTIVINTGTLQVDAPGCLNGNPIIPQNNNLSCLRIGGTPTGDFTNSFNMGSYNAVFMDVTNAGANVQWNGPVIGSGAGVFAKIGAGTLSLKKASPSFTAAFHVRAGRLNVNYTTASLSGVAVSNGASFGGFGTNHIAGGGPIAGDGSIDPGSNSAGILTTAAVDPSSTTGTLDFAFELGAAGSPDYANPSTSSNAVLRLTNAVPFCGDTMTPANAIRVYLPADLRPGITHFRGGFYTEQGNFLSSFSGASLQCFAKKAGGPVIHNGQEYDSMTNVYRRATVGIGMVNETGTQFGGVDGYVTTFTFQNPTGTLILIQ